MIQMQDNDDIPLEHRLQSRVLGDVDASGGTLTTLFNALAAADEAGLHVESDEDRATDIDNYLDMAMDEVDSDEPDPREVLDYIESARSAATDFRRGLADEVRDYEPPDYVDLGVYDTFGSYARHVEQTLVSMEYDAEEWLAATD